MDKEKLTNHPNSHSGTFLAEDSPRSGAFRRESEDRRVFIPYSTARQVAVHESGRMRGYARPGAAC